MVTDPGLLDPEYEPVPEPVQLMKEYPLGTAAENWADEP
jgi:hypothetical protein